MKIDRLIRQRERERKERRGESLVRTWWLACSTNWESSGESGWLVYHSVKPPMLGPHFVFFSLINTKLLFFFVRCGANHYNNIFSLPWSASSVTHSPLLPFQVRQICSIWARIAQSIRNGMTTTDLVVHAQVIRLKVFKIISRWVGSLAALLQCS